MDYSNSAWPDKATFYNGNDITYDASGNPTSLDGATLQWENGRWLKSYSKGAVSASYTYDSNGIRTEKNTGDSSNYSGEVRKYTTVDGRITSEYVSGGGMGISSYDYRVYYRYDENNSPIGFDLIKDGTTSTYTYEKNIKGDIVGIIDDSTGAKVVSYSYDAWGKLLSTSGLAANTVGKYNSLRYRGYYYDSETGYYYLQSRYYDPGLKRFINADEPMLITELAKASALGGNLFAYCWNNAVNMVDYEGAWPTAALKKTSNFISLEMKFPWKDIELYFKNRSFKMAVIGIIVCFIPDPTVSKALGVSAGIDSIISGVIGDVIAKKKSGKSIRIGFSFNYKIVVNSKYVYIVNTRWVKIGFWSQWRTAKLSIIKWWVKL